MSLWFNANHEQVFSPVKLNSSATNNWKIDKNYTASIRLVAGEKSKNASAVNYFVTYKFLDRHTLPFFS